MMEEESAATFSPTASSCPSSRVIAAQDDTTTTTTTTKMNTNSMSIMNQKITRQHEPHPQPPHIVLLLENSRKNNNWGPVLRCASAFGIQTVVFVGFAQCSVRGSHGANQHVQIIAFPTVQQAVDFIRNEYNHYHQYDLLDANNNSINNENNDTSTSSPTTKILGLLGAVPGGYSSDGCALRLAVDNDDDEGTTTTTDEIDKSLNHAAGLVQAILVEEDHVVDDVSSTAVSPSWSSIWSSSSSSRRSYPVSNEARMRHVLFSSSSENSGVEKQQRPQQHQQQETTKTVVLAISKDLHGLPLSLAQHCEAFCHVPHMAIPAGHCAAASCDDASSTTTSTTAQQQMMFPPPPPRPLLDLPTTLSIALHHICGHLGYREGEFQGHKFQVCSSKQKTSLQNEQACHDQRKIQEHRAQEQKYQEQLVSDAMDNAGLSLWGQDEQENDDY